ncbi:hypothetical protein K6119_06930 [Paracrocinitomix mangrovi]|uniref:hypothetical protein n=1 Tax=Paracrocinitomix mangrovi TaxID=2862509 RepID=UPI001C8EF859|nr:hypothetical protein [Paracrocinitomix mangrovi]UKN03247.1 hypothetical protein K6119_06930 [Paracrocinitomix mangrovi]
MLKTAFLLSLTIVLVYLGLELASSLTDIPRSEIFSWTGIIFLAYLVEKSLKYILMLPFKAYFKDVQRHALAKTVQETGITLSYISVWLAVGFTPINGIVQGKEIDHLITNPIFIKIALVLFFATIVFSLLWLLSLKIQK